MIGAIIIIVLVIIVGIAINIYQEKKTNKIKFDNNSTKMCLPTITFSNNGQDLTFLLDSGATYSAIDINLLDSLNYQKRLETSTSYSASGNSITTNFIDLSLSYNNVVYTDMFQVFDMTGIRSNIKEIYDVTISGLLGSNFFITYSSCIDYNNKCLINSNYECKNKTL